jgi:hypothetical protein
VIANDIVLRVIDALNAEQIRSMLVGSYSSNAYGIERSTQDADFVIELQGKSIGSIAKALAPEIIIDPQLIFESVTLTNRFVAKHQSSGFKVELFLLGDEPFERQRFQRRQQVPFADRFVWLPTPEDVIVQKLRWFSLAKRSKDWDDARSVTAVQYSNLDLAYIRNWCDQHGTRDLFEKLFLEAKEIQPEQT